MQYTQHSTPDGLVVALRGGFTFQDHSSFRAVLDIFAASGGSRHVLDLSQVDFLDSAALGMLLIAEDEASKFRSTLTLRDPSTQITRLFELSAMDSMFQIERTPGRAPANG